MKKHGPTKHTERKPEGEKKTENLGEPWCPGALVANERKCRVCGCTDATPCMHTGLPCWWIEKDLCSDCASEEVSAKYDEDFEQFYLTVMEIWAEYFEARLEHPVFRNHYHAAARLRKEGGALWNEVRQLKWDKKAMRKEAIQVAVTAIRFVVDLIDNEVEQ